MPEDPLCKVNGEIRLGVSREVGETNNADHLTIRIKEDLVS